MASPTSASNPLSVGERKAALRREVMARRRVVHQSRRVEASEALATRVRATFPSGDISVAGYWPLGDEIDCRPALEVLKAAGAQVSLPVAAGQGQVLIFRAWCPGDPLESGPFGTSHPAVRAPVAAPDILLLPLIAFDASGHRLGYGAGYYDRTVMTLRLQRKILVVGVAYDEQEADEIPVDGHDQRMDAVITDRRVLCFNGVPADFKP